MAQLRFDALISYYKCDIHKIKFIQENHGGSYMGQGGLPFYGGSDG